MNDHAELTRDKGLLENALTMTSFSMPSQADVIDYEITLLAEKKNQMFCHIEELAAEAAERLAEINVERAAIIAEMEHYKHEYSEALRRQNMARHLYGANSQQVEKHQAAFAFSCEMYDKAKSKNSAIGEEMLELESTLSDLREQLAGETLPVIQNADDLPFESATATAISAERFQQILETVDVIPAVESYMGRDIDSILSDVDEGFNSAKMCICSAIGSEVWESEELTDAEKEAFELALATQFETVAEHLEEVHAASQLPSQRRINAVYHRI